MCSIITVVQFQYALAASADQFSPGYKMLQSVHPGDLINPGAKESSPSHVENTEEELKLDTTAFSILSHLSYLSCFD